MKWQSLEPLVHPEDCWFIISNFIILYLQIIFKCVPGCLTLNLLAEHVCSISRVTPLLPQSSIFTTQMRGVNRWKRGRLTQQQWLTWMKLTNKGDIDCRVQLLPSFPPSLLFDPVDVKAGSSTKHPVWRGRKHHVVFFFLWSDVWCYFLWDIQHKNLKCYTSYGDLSVYAAGLEPAIL